MQGLIVINKPKDITSFQVVAAVRRLTGVKRVGHAGTLDPIAEGVLPVLIGRPCVLSNYLTGEDKTYIAGVKLGITSDTYDITGTLSEGKEVSVTDGQLKAAFLAFTGSIMQVPPMYSAKKVDGKKLYELARSGRTIERRACPVHISSITLMGPVTDNTFNIEVHCSAGTYIRSLVHDIGSYLGCGAVMTSLVRTESAGFGIEESVGLCGLTETNIENFVLKEDAALKHYRGLNVSGRQALRFYNGGALSRERLGCDNAYEDEIIRVYFKGEFIGLGQMRSGELKVLCPINRPDFELPARQNN